MFKVMRCVKSLASKVFRRSSRVHTDVEELSFSSVCVRSAEDSGPEGIIDNSTTYASESVLVRNIGLSEGGHFEADDAEDDDLSQAWLEAADVRMETLDGRHAVNGRPATPQDMEAIAAYAPRTVTIHDLVWRDNGSDATDSDTFGEASVSTRYVDTSEAGATADQSECNLSARSSNLEGLRVSVPCLCVCVCVCVRALLLLLISEVAHWPYLASICMKRG
eukprot:TRINITY_DN9419_c0_g1_i1.p1 TRINITY_DN9419_c0_g1~~TRINITY_DN9419_c0_g1_i1.p1  ORF type:complete len:221 (-),score=20.20 TRINITY_DN9419_c0_g1_i1:94-756(-)